MKTPKLRVTDIPAYGISPGRPAAPGKWSAAGRKITTDLVLMLEWPPYVEVYVKGYGHAFL